jgi:hypothetical protein
VEGDPEPVSALNCNRGYSIITLMRPWVLLAYRLPREPSTPRIALWRSLRRLGAAQVGDGLVALPLDAETREQIEWLSSDIEEFGGESSVWLAEAATNAQEERWVNRLLEAVSAEYRDLMARAIAAADEDDAIRRRSLRQLRAERRRIRTRDYFRAPEGDEAAAAIERLASSPAESTP